jgi:hypothetical protein
MYHVLDAVNGGRAANRRSTRRWFGLAYPLNVRWPEARAGMVFRCLYIDTPNAEFQELPSRYQAGFLDPDAVWSYARDPESDLDETSVRRSLMAGDECFAIRDGDTLAAYGWYSRAPGYVVSETLRLHFDPSWTLMYRGFTHPRYRGRRLHAVGMTLALSAALARGARGLVSTVEHWNTASLRSCARMGYRVFGSIYEIRLGRVFGLRDPSARWLRRHLVWHTPGCARFGFRLEALPPRDAGHPRLASPSPLLGKPSRHG